MSNETWMLKDGKPYTTAAATNVLATFEKQIVNGLPWVRPSRDPATIAKWKYFKELHLQVAE
jgi:hypothetical protein